MINTDKYDKVSLGAVAGFILPVIIFLIVYIVSSHEKTIAAYAGRIVRANILTHIISLCVFPNIFLFLVTNRLDMLKATKGVLGITIFWAALVFAVKFLV